MSQTSNGSAIKRFTYDWLIRFAELHPFQSFYFDGHPSVAFNLLTSKYAAISPIFARLIIRHMPYLYYGNQLHVSNRKIVKKFGLQPDLQSFELPSPKKYSIYICGVCHITELTPDLFTWFEDNRIIFYGEHIYMTKSGATVVNDPSPNTSGPRLQQFHNERMLLFSTTTLTEPIDFSEVCPFLAHYKYITLYIPVIYGTSFTNIARKNQFTPERFYVFEQDVSDNVMLEMVDYFLSLPNRSSDFEITFHQSKPTSLIKVVVDKIVAAGFQKQHCVASQKPFTLIQVFISKESGIFYCYFLPSSLENDHLYLL